MAWRSPLQPYSPAADLERQCASILLLTPGIAQCPSWRTGPALFTCRTAACERGWAESVARCGTYPAMMAWVAGASARTLTAARSMDRRLGQGSNGRDG